MKLLATTTAAAAVVGAGQLGIAYGLSMVRLDRDLDVTASDQWTAQLAWVAWIAMTAAAVGAIVATGLRPRWRPQPIGTGGALGIGLAAGLGALAVIPLTMQPARAASVAGVNPVFVIGVCAGLGAAAGIFAAWAAAAKAVARWSLGTLTVLVWAVALISIAPSLLPGRTPAAPIRLGVLEGNLIPAAITEHTPFVTMPVLALLAGLICGLVARGRRLSTLAVALSGLAGPALLTVAYLIAGPGEGTRFDLNPYWAAMIASGAGVLGSVLAAVLRSSADLSSSAATASASPSPASSSAAARDAAGRDSAGRDSAGRDSAGRDSAGRDSAGRDSAGRGAAAGGAPGTESGPSRDRTPEPTPLPRRDTAGQAAPNPSAIAAAAAAAAQRPAEQLRPSDTGVLPAVDRPHPLADLANQSPATAPNSPFASGSGSPFGQPPSATPAYGQQHPTGQSFSQPPAGAPSAGQHAHAASTGHQPAHGPSTGRQSPGAPPAGRQPQASPSPGQPQGSPSFDQQSSGAAQRFSGQQEPNPSPRRGWRTRRSAQENPPPPAGNSFDGFATGNPGPRTGIDTAEHPRITAAMPRPPAIEPTSISGPPAQRGPRGQQESEYVNWVNGLGGS